MIMKLLFELVIFLLGQFFGLLSNIFPYANELTLFYNAISSLLGVSTQVVNFLYFIFGQFYYPFIVLCSWFVPFRLVTVPVLSFARKFIPFVGQNA